MKKKELKNLAQKIAEFEKTIQQGQNSEEIQQAKESILKLSSKVKSLEEIAMLDEMIQDYLKK